MSQLDSMTTAATTRESWSVSLTAAAGHTGHSGRLWSAFTGGTLTMSGEKATSPCNKFQANIFNKSKCQNCFKSRELHLFNDHNMEQAKPIYAGWLCLAPVGTDFNNPLQRSRKWQRRFFILYEHGSLSFALDELPSTLPQGTVNMNLCTDLTDAEPRTGQKNALCIVASEQEIFIRGDNREIINGWSEQLGLYLRPNKHTLKKKRKVDTAASPEPSPAKMAATCPSSDDPESVCGQWQEVQQGADVTPAWTVPDSEPPPAGLDASHMRPAFEESPGFSDGSADLGRVHQLTEPGPNKLQTPANNRSTRQNRREVVPSVKSLKRTEKENEGAAANRTGRTNKREKLQSCGDMAQLTVPPLPLRRARSLDRRTSDTAMTPDLLNFKKGWMVRLDENNQWMKYWFVLSTDSLRYYKDSVAEEASALEGEMDLRLCYNVSEYQVQRNYGFQIHTLNGVHTLSAMTAGIRKNWIQALMKNVQPGHAPDTSSVPGPLLWSPPEVLPKPDLTQDAPEVSIERQKSKSITERRREGRYRTFDWADFRPQTKPDPAEAHRTPPLSALELGDLARRKRREERRKKYESMLGFSLDRDGTGGGPLSPTSRQKLEEDMERCWRQVENTVFRLDRTVPIICDRKDPEETETLLHGLRTRIEEQKAQLSESELRRLELEAQLNSTKDCSSLNSPSLNKADFNVLDENTSTARLFDKTNEEKTEQEQLMPPQTPTICLHDPDGNVKEITHSASPLMSAAPDSSSLPRTEEGLKPETQELPRDLLKRDSEVLPDSVGKETSSDSDLLERLSQEVELLTNQNQTLHRHNQEMLNQLTEADREIQRLKDELRGKSEDTVQLSEEQHQGQTRLENLQRELDVKKQELTEAQRLISLLEDNVKETKALLVQTETKQTREDDARAENNQGYLLRCFEATEARLKELTKKLEQSEAEREELLEQNTELRETEKLYRLNAAEAEADVTKLSEELENEKQRQNRSLCQEQTQNVKEGLTMRFKTLEKLLEVAQKLDLSVIKRQRVCETTGTESVIRTGLKWEESFWSLMLTELKMNEEEEPLKELLRELTEHMIAEKHMIVSGVEMSRDVKKNDSNTAQELDIINSINETNRSETFVLKEKLFEKEKSIIEHFRASAQTQLFWLNNIDHSLNDYQGLWKFSAHPWFGFIHSAAVEALCCCHMSSLQSVYQKQLEEAKEKLSSALNCSRCMELTEENKRLKEALLNLEDTFASSLGQKVDVCCQTETYVEISSKRQDRREENVSFEEARSQNGAVEEKYMEISGAEDEKEMETLQTSHEPVAETKQRVVSSEEFELRSRVQELEELLHVSEKQKQEFELEMSSGQVRHEKEVDKLKDTCERAFSSMEDSHVKVVEELQRRHRLELQRLLVERDRLLEEECAATATAIKAIKKAHRLELEREVQRRSQSQSSSPDLQDIYSQHSEELDSSQRQLQVLSQQFSLKCLENVHLVQALDAERKALCQCQQENQDLRTKNQELSVHLAAEITRLCSLAKQDALLLTQGMGLYELEITLRVKESEVQCLKQELTSLKEELQSARRDERKASKQYKEVLTELSLSRARWERDVEELRENRRLLHQALGQTSL